jgi:hypothetical protein
MYQAEALWIAFGGRWGRGRYPFAVKIAAGKINAVTGEGWSNELTGAPQDYVVVSDQPWLDGFCVRKGLNRQFVAMPLGAGYTAEEQLTGAAEHGGLQIIVYPMKRERYEEQLKHRTDVGPSYMCCGDPDASMGLAPGGLMRQEIYEDEYGFDAWDRSVSSRCFVDILNSAQWQAATGKAAPGTPPTAVDYTKAGLPWFEVYADGKALDGAKKLAGLDGVAGKAIKQGEAVPAGNEPVEPANIVKLGKTAATVSEGKW